MLVNFLRDCLLRRRLLSPAKWWTELNSITVCKSLMTRRISGGPKTDPCFLTFENELNHLFVSPWVPQCSNFLNRTLWLTVSNTFWRSKNILQEYFSVSQTDSIFPVISNRACVVECPCLKPNCFSYLIDLLNSRT